ncbi:MAG: hypothetical protein ACRC9V_10580, partial [Aeromonas sp.]
EQVNTLICQQGWEMFYFQQVHDNPHIGFYNNHIIESSLNSLHLCHFPSAEMNTPGLLIFIIILFFDICVVGKIN